MKKQIIKKILIVSLMVIITGCTVEPASDEPAADVPVPDETATVNNDYDGGLFDHSKVHAIDIEMAEEDWNDLLENALDKTKYHCDITIDGELIKNVSCSTKGNSSLVMAKEKFNNGRYSLKIDFDKYEDGQKYHELKKINLTNGFSDTTYLKDYLCYTMFNRAGVDGPLCSFSWVKVNGKDHGLFLTVEECDKSFLKRTGWKDSILYKPDSDKLVAGGDELEKIIQNGIQIEDYSEGADLRYRGDKIEDYPDIFNNNETKAEDEDKLRVIKALKGLSEEKDLENYLYTDKIIRYFAVHNFTINYDCYTGPMLHNYYLCEKEGKLAIFPWDYNMAFGTALARHNKEESDSTRLINYGIDTPLMGTTAEQRPMWKWIIDNDKYKKEYHEAIDEFIKSYFESGKFEQDMDETIRLIEPYVEKDPTSFAGAEAFSSSTKALNTFCLLRAESIRRQLDGKLASRTQDQSAADQVDASAINIGQLN